MSTIPFIPGLPRKLTVLMYSDNSCYPITTNSLVPGLEIIFFRNKPIGWKFKNPDDSTAFKPEIRNIGRFNYSMQSCCTGVIGVYDKSQEEQLTQMLRDWMDIYHRD
jgi:hypothetical protein